MEEFKMSEIKTCYCPYCEKETAHDIYIDTSGYVHSLCTQCGKDEESRKRVKKICLYSRLECSREQDNKLHIKYLDTNGYIHWFCLSCGKDIESRSRVDSC